MAMLTVSMQSLPNFIEATATVNDDKQDLMALAMKDYPTVGVQFHPESVLTQEGNRLLANFLKY